MVTAAPASAYASLGLPTGTPLSDVRRVYRARLRQFHPDTGGAAAQAAERIAEVQRAFRAIAEAAAVQPTLALRPDGRPRLDVYA